MNKLDALETINKTWNDKNIPLSQKIKDVSEAFYSSGLELTSTAAFIKATPTELALLLKLGELDSEILERITRANLPKTTWMYVVSANEDELDVAINSILENMSNIDRSKVSISDYLYHAMIDYAGPTKEQKVASLSGEVLKHAFKKAEAFSALSDWEKKFLNSVAGQRKTGKTLSEKQAAKLVVILNNLVEKKAICRNSIDGDQGFCDAIMDALEID